MTTALHWVTALACESAPIRKHFGLETVPGSHPFRLYRSADRVHWLVESGIGRVNAAAAVMSLHHAAGAQHHACWLNVGIAAHRDIPIGEARIAHQIIEESTGRTAYPMLVFNPSIDTERLTTVDRVQERPESDTLYDMEGSAFFDVASRLSSAERAVLVKIISDHGMEPGSYPTREDVSHMIANQIENLETIVTALLDISREEADRLAPPPGYEALVDKVHFSASLQHQLKDLLRRYHLLELSLSLDEIAADARDGRAVVRRLRDALDGQRVNWEQS